MIPTLEEKEKIVKDHYQSAYRCRFKKALEKKDIEFLYNSMIKLGWSYQNYISAGGPEARKLKRTLGLVPISGKSVS